MPGFCLRGSRSPGVGDIAGRNCRNVWTITEEQEAWLRYVAEHVPEARLGELWGEFAATSLQDVWTFATCPFKGSHYATFPPELPRRCILAGTSAEGACPEA